MRVVITFFHILLDGSNILLFVVQGLEEETIWKTMLSGAVKNLLVSLDVGMLGRRIR